MSTIANAKVAHNYNRYNGYFFGCLLNKHILFLFGAIGCLPQNVGTFEVKRFGVSIQTPKCFLKRPKCY